MAKPLPEFTKQDITRFWSMVNRQDDCWPWTGGTSNDGYGRFVVYKETGKRLLQATRVAILLTTGVDDPKLDACHSCDNPICCNPSHLWLGTRAENMQDAIRKGRMTAPKVIHHGEGNGQSKLTKEGVREIRILLNQGVLLLREIAALHNVSIRTVTKIRDRKTWKYLT